MLIFVALNHEASRKRSQIWPVCNRGITQFYLPVILTRTISVSTPQPEVITTLWLVLIAPTHEGMARLSWPGWLVTDWDKCPAPGIECEHGHTSQY